MGVLYSGLPHIYMLNPRPAHPLRPTDSDKKFLVDAGLSGSSVDNIVQILILIMIN
jgi:hypothetical protein